MNGVSERLIEEALAALDEVSIRELEAAAKRLDLRRDGLREFGRVFADVANGRESGFSQARYLLASAIAGLDDRTATSIENGQAPFWQAVREAVDAPEEG